MSVKIRLARVGRRKAPYYRIVVADSRRARDGRFIEIVGRYQPLQKEGDQHNVDEERALKWMSEGATPSDTVRSIFRKLGIMRKFHEQRQANRFPWILLAVCDNSVTRRTRQSKYVPPRGARGTSYGIRPLQYSWNESGRTRSQHSRCFLPIPICG